jgi:putative ubiquitin-RnfH superfamily antitoxin RatB of RatAB toxin-antitoxin module
MAEVPTGGALVVHALPDQVIEIAVALPPGASLFDVVRASGLLQRCPGLDLGDAKLGVWGKLRDPASLAAPGDRIEIYRPLVADPKASRSQRARKKARQK